MQNLLKQLTNFFNQKSNKNDLKNWQILLIILLLSTSVFLRFWKIEYVPYPDDADELAQIYAGQSLFTYGTPISWSSFAYTDSQWLRGPAESSTVNKPASYTFIRPWFDHSFLLPIVVGGWSLLGGYEFPSIPPALWYRLPMLVASAASLILIYLISKKLFGFWAGVFSTIIIGFSPSLIFIQRMVVSENFIALFVLLALYFYIEKRSLAMIIIASVLAGLTKVTGLVIVPIIFFALLHDKEYKKAFAYTAITIAIAVGLYLLYGFSIDSQEFFVALKNQSSRLLGWFNPAFIFASPGFQTKEFLDYSYYLILFLGISIFWTSQHEKAKVIMSSIIIMYLTIWVTSAEQDMLGWYKIPLFCVLAIAAGSVFSFKKYFLPTFLLAVTFFNNLGIVRYPVNPLPEAQILRVIVGLLLLISFAYIYFQPKVKIKIIGIVVVSCLYIGQSFYIIDTYYEALCRDRICSTPLVTLNTVIKDTLNKIK